jgi:hypothetical protein
MIREGIFCWTEEEDRRKRMIPTVLHNRKTPTGANAYSFVWGLGNIWPMDELWNIIRWGGIKYEL